MEYQTSCPRRTSISSANGNLDCGRDCSQKCKVRELSPWSCRYPSKASAEGVRILDNVGLLDVKQKWDRSGLDMTHLVSFAARQPSLTVAFNYASLLLNNSYFLETLVCLHIRLSLTTCADLGWCQTGSDVKKVPKDYASLGDKVEAFAEGIVGGGWLWVHISLPSWSTAGSDVRNSS